MPLASLGGRHLEAEGRPVGGRAVMRIRDVSDPAYPILARHLRTRRANLSMTIAALQARLQAERASANQYSESLAG